MKISISHVLLFLGASFCMTCGSILPAQISNSSYYIDAIMNNAIHNVFKRCARICIRNYIHRKPHFLRTYMHRIPYMSMFVASTAQSQSSSSAPSINRNIAAYYRAGLIREMTGQTRYRFWTADV